MAWFDTGEAMSALNALGRDANNFIKRTMEEIEKDLARVEVNVGAPGIRFGQSRNGNAAGTSEGGPMGSETKGPVKKAMACEGCSTKFSFMRRKRECLECRRLYCTQCLPKTLPVSGSGSGGWCSRERRQTMCNKCLILLAQPPSRSALLGLRTRDLQAFLASRKVPTHGCLEKDDLVNLVVQLSNGEGNDPQLGVPPGGYQSPLSGQYPPSASPDSGRCWGDAQSPRSDMGEATPGVHSFATRGDVHSPSFPMPPSTPPEQLSNPPTSPSQLPSQDLPYSPIPSGDDGRTIGEAASSPAPPQASSPEPSQVPLAQTQPQPAQPRPPGTLPSGQEEEDWVMIDLEERFLPPYSAMAPGTHPQPTPPPTTTAPEADATSPQTRSPERTVPSPSRTEAFNPPMESTRRSPSSRVDGAGITSPLSASTPDLNHPGEMNPGDTEGNTQASASMESPSLNRPSASVSQGSSPSKTNGPLLAPRDIASSILSSTKSEDDLSTLSVKQLKELLTSSRVDYRGCCEKRELLERAQRLWREYKASQENLSDETMCKVCMDACIDCVMLECGHMATCTPCGKRMSECPICRQFVVRIVRTFKA